MAVTKPQRKRESAVAWARGRGWMRDWDHWEKTTQRSGQSRYIAVYGRSSTWRAYALGSAAGTHETMRAAMLAAERAAKAKR